MRMSSRIKLTAAGAAAVAAVAAFSGPSQAQSSKSTPTETGCYDITGGTIDFTRATAYTFFDVTPTIEHEPDAGSLTTHLHEAPAVKTYSAVLTDDADVVVAATTANTTGLDCSDVRYRLRITDENQQPVSELVVPGGTGDTIVWKTGFAYPDPDAVGRFAYFSATTETSKGRVVDTAPDDVNGLLVELGAGGATSGFN